jgi:hypothetical protein
MRPGVDAANEASQYEVDRRILSFLRLYLRSSRFSKTDVC